MIDDNDKENDPDDSQGTDSSMDRSETTKIRENGGHYMKCLYNTKQKPVVAYTKQASFILEHGYCIAVVFISWFSGCYIIVSSPTK